MIWLAAAAVWPCSRCCRQAWALRGRVRVRGADRPAWTCTARNWWSWTATWPSAASARRPRDRGAGGAAPPAGRGRGAGPAGRTARPRAVDPRHGAGADGGDGTVSGRRPAGAAGAAPGQPGMRQPPTANRPKRRRRWRSSATRWPASTRTPTRARQGEVMLGNMEASRGRFAEAAIAWRSALDQRFDPMLAVLVRVGRTRHRVRAGQLGAANRATGWPPRPVAAGLPPHGRTPPRRPGTAAVSAAEGGTDRRLGRSVKGPSPLLRRGPAAAARPVLHCGCEDSNRARTAAAQASAAADQPGRSPDQ